MKYIVVRTYGNGKWMNEVYPMWFDYLSQAQRICDELNENTEEREDHEKWIVMPIRKYVGKVY